MITKLKVTGTFADTINWAKISNEEMRASLGKGSEAQKAFNKAIKDGETQEDAFSAALAATKDQQERANIVASFLNNTYGESKKTYDEMTGSIQNAASAELELKETQSELAEAIEPVNTAFSEFKNKALQALLPIVESLAQKFLEFKQYLEEHPTLAKVLTAAIISLGTAFGILAGALAIQGLIKGVTAAIALLNTTLLANPIVLIVSAVAALVAGFIYLWKNCEGFRNFWIKLWEGIKNIISTVVDWIKNNWKSLVLFLMNPLAGLFKYFYDNFEGFRNFVDGFVQNIKEFFSNLWNGIKNIFSSVASWFNDNVVQPIKSFFAPLVEWFTTLFTEIKNFITSVWNVISQLAEGCVIAIKLIWGLITSWFNENIIIPIKTFFTELWGTISNAASEAWNKIVEIWSVVSTWFQENITQPIADVFTGVWNSIKSGASDAWEGIKSVFGAVAKFFGDKFTEAWEKVKGVFSTGGKIFDGIKDGIVSAFKSIVNAIIRGINKVVSIPFKGINSALKTIRDISILGVEPFKGLISTIDVPQIPELAKGDVAKKNKPYLALLGDNKKETEVISPLSTMRKAFIEAMKDMGLEDIKKIKMDLGNELNINYNRNLSNLNSDTSFGKTVVVNQTINSPKSLSRSEIYRQTKNIATSIAQGG